jgi:catechol 2,3-dioxygenase-like lactoylglutathione lyase family enzyme
MSDYDYTDIFGSVEVEEKPEPTKETEVTYDIFGDDEDESPTIVETDEVDVAEVVEEPVVEETVEAPKGLYVPEVWGDDDCTHHFIIPQRGGDESVGICKFCGGGRIFHNRQPSDWS